MITILNAKHQNFLLSNSGILVEKRAVWMVFSDYFAYFTVFGYHSVQTADCLFNDVLKADKCLPFSSESVLLCPGGRDWCGLSIFKLYQVAGSPEAAPGPVQLWRKKNTHFMYKGHLRAQLGVLAVIKRVEVVVSP